MKNQKSIGHQRLAKLASFLYRVPRKRFDMTRWKGEGTLSLNPTECNTAGCAIGWASVLFRDDGFSLVSNGLFLLPGYHTTTGWQAIMNFFDLEAEDSYALFEASTVTQFLGPRQAATAIKKFLKTGKVSYAS